MRTQFPQWAALAAFAFLPGVASGQQAPPAEQTHSPDKRIFGVLPNYRTAESTDVEPLTAKQKFRIAYKDSFDWPVFLLSGAFAGLSHVEDENPSFGQGLKGYARRYPAAYGDQMIGNIMTEGLFPSLLHEDLRYFRRAKGSVLSRTGYAMSRILVTRTDSGHQRFNFSEVIGNSVGVAISNAYYPDTRNAADNIQKLGMQLATDLTSNILKEFWPDVKRKLHERRLRKASQAPATP